MKSIQIVNLQGWYIRRWSSDKSARLQIMDKVTDEAWEGREGLLDITILVRSTLDLPVMKIYGFLDWEHGMGGGYASWKACSSQS